MAVWATGVYFAENEVERGEDVWVGIIVILSIALFFVIKNRKNEFP